MNFKLLFAFLTLSIFMVSCGDDDSSVPSLEYPITATFSGIVNQTEMKAYVNSGGTVTEIGLDETDVDDDSIFDNLEGVSETVSYLFESETMATIYDSDPFFGDTSTATITLESDGFTIVQDFQGIMITYNADGDPTDFTIPGNAYNIESPGSGGFGAAGPMFPGETPETLQATLEEGDTMVIMTYDINFKQQ